jgi:hypothetical protein
MTKEKQSSDRAQGGAASSGAAMTAHEADIAKELAIIRGPDMFMARNLAFRTVMGVTQAAALMHPDSVVRSQALLNLNISPTLIGLIRGDKSLPAEDVNGLFAGLKKHGVPFGFDLASESGEIRLLVNRASDYHSWLRSDEGQAYVLESAKLQRRMDFHQNNSRHAQKIQAKPQQHHHIDVGAVFVGAVQHLLPRLQALLHRDKPPASAVPVNPVAKADAEPLT